MATSGTATAPVVFTAGPGAAVTLTGGTDGFKLSGKNWIIVHGFNINHTISYGL